MSGLGLLTKTSHVLRSAKHFVDPGFSPYLVLEPADFQGTGHPTAHVLIERYRRLYVNLFKSAGIDSGLSVGVVSAVAREGKTTVLANLGVTMAMDLHKKVLLVDANFEDPQLARIFGVEDGPGIDDWLVGAVPFEAIIRDTNIENLKVLPLGKGVNSPLKWVDSDAFRKLSARVVREFDVILWDTPALLTSSVGVTMVKKLRRAVVVTRLSYTRRAVLRQALELVDDVPVLGVVPNFREFWIPQWLYKFL